VAECARPVGHREPSARVRDQPAEDDERARRGEGRESRRWVTTPDSGWSGLSNASTARSSGDTTAWPAGPVALTLVTACSRAPGRCRGSPRPSTHAVQIRVPLSPIAVGRTLTPRSASVDVTIWRRIPFVASRRKHAHAGSRIVVAIEEGWPACAAAAEEDDGKRIAAPRRAHRALRATRLPADGRGRRRPAAERAARLERVTRE